MQGVFDQLRLASNDSMDFHRYRNEVFVYLSAIHSATGHSSPQIPKNDEWLSLGEKILRNKLFEHHPGSQNRLIPLAKEYVNSFQGLDGTVQVNTFDSCADFKSCLQIFAKIHDTFARAYDKEIQFVYKSEPQVVRVTHQSDINFFVVAYLHSLSGRSLVQLEELKEKIADQDTEFVYLFPRIALEYMLQLESKKNPKIFDPCTSKIEALSESYAALSFDEQKSVRCALRGDELQLSADAKNVYVEIMTVASLCQTENQQASLYAALMSHIYADIEKCLGMAVQVKKASFELPLNYNNMYEILLFSRLSFENALSDFDFFAQCRIVELRKRYMQLNVQEQETIRNVLFVNINGDLGAKSSHFFRDLKYYSNQLAFHKDSALLACAFRLAGNLTNQI